MYDRTLCFYAQHVSLFVLVQCYQTLFKMRDLVGVFQILSVAVCLFGLVRSFVICLRLRSGKLVGGTCSDAAKIKQTA